ncbi:DUF4860 domain-containing protein [Dysosmobacter sp.]|uniref:DUF4860 domain-containing protein n=1 Tax=Dysosmobacter sp. TaxID=2591382 RepID=UPI002A8F3F9B|nr:DUF4860 domain-containing protein [Dysosmobacter sp.]MDY3282023.1 DUF4860 domain-containing protein [Dysosmobacter sp.]
MGKADTRRTEGLLALVMFALFAVLVLGVLLAGAGVCRRLTERDARAFDRRTALQYVATRVRSAAGSVTVEDFAGPDSTLCFAEEIEGETYLTRLYCWDGAMRELFCAAGEPFAPEDGEIIVSMAEMRFTEENGLLTAEAVAGDGSEAAVSLFLRERGDGA